MIGVDVLAQQRDLAHAARHQIARLGQKPLRRTADFGPARIGDDAKGAELVAALLHGQKGGRPAQHPAVRQVVELVLGREFGVDGAGTLPHGLQHRGQAVIALRADDQIDHRRAAQNLGTLGLGDTAGDGNLHAGFCLFQRLQPAQIGIDLFGGLLADVTGVEQHHVGVFGSVGGDIALGAQRFRHAFGIVDVHLAAIGLDEELLRRRHAHASRGEACCLHDGYGPSQRLGWGAWSGRDQPGATGRDRISRVRPGAGGLPHRRG